jgi:hypothetical protein
MHIPNRFIVAVATSGALCATSAAPAVAAAPLGGQASCIGQAFSGANAIQPGIVGEAVSQYNAMRREDSTIPPLGRGLSQVVHDC